MAATGKTENPSQPPFSETVKGGTVCRKAARTGLWGSREATNCSTRKLKLNRRISEALLRVFPQWEPI